MKPIRSLAGRAASAAGKLGRQPGPQQVPAEPYTGSLIFLFECEIAAVAACWIASA
jgi:hypothetical protein